MTTSRKARRLPLLAAILTFANLSAGVSGATAQDAAPPKKHHVRSIRTADAAPPLTVRRRAPRLVSGDPIVAGDGFYDNVGLFRRWDDPRLYNFYGWRLGGDNFYGDQAGDSITRGNAGLGMVAGYGPARGGYGGPHFDSVGGFHNGPGPEAQESADYATGSIWQPRYDRPQPQYPSIRQQVADLGTGIADTGQVVRVKSMRERWEETYRPMSSPVRGVPQDSPYDRGDF